MGIPHLAHNDLPFGTGVLSGEYWRDTALPLLSTPNQAVVLTVNQKTAAGLFRPVNLRHRIFQGPQGRLAGAVGRYQYGLWMSMATWHVHCPYGRSSHMGRQTCGLALSTCCVRHADMRYRLASHAYGAAARRQSRESSRPAATYSLTEALWGASRFTDGARQNTLCSRPFGLRVIAATLPTSPAGSSVRKREIRR